MLKRVNYVFLLNFIEPNTSHLSSGLDYHRLVNIVSYLLEWQLSVNQSLHY